MESDRFTLTEYEKASLKNIWENCSKNAVEGFSGTLSRKIRIESFSIETMVLNDVPKMLDPEDTSTTVFWVPIKGKINGAVILCSAYYDILKMADMLLKMEMGHYKEINEENISVINDLVYIIVGYYMDFLVKLFEIKMEKPSWSISPYKMLEFIELGNVYRERIEVLVFQTKFLITDEDIKGNIVMIFRREMAESILRALSSRVVSSLI